MSTVSLPATPLRGCCHRACQLIKCKPSRCVLRTPVKRGAWCSTASHAAADPRIESTGNPASEPARSLLIGSAGSVAPQNSDGLQEQTSVSGDTQQQQQQFWWRRHGRLLGPCLLGLFIVGTWVLGQAPAFAKAAAKAAAEIPAGSGFSLGDALKGTSQEVGT
jgi:hypothetical protein